MQAMTVCKNCGREFVYTYIKEKRTVCGECKRVSEAERNRVYRAKLQNKPKGVSPNARLIAAANKASSLGITYGKYMGRWK